MKVAFLAGTSIVNSDQFAAWEVRAIETRYGLVTYKQQGDFLLINRHGYGFPLPPHAINHRANIRALADLGYEDVIAINSVGSLKPALPPGTLVSCSDYVAIQTPPQTFFDEELRGGTPGIDNNLIPLLATRLAPEFDVKAGKIYVQMRGPRFETKAEVQLLKQWGDVVGMTLAGEADLCREVGLHLNSLAMVDNFANGLMHEEISFEKFQVLVKANQEKVNRLFQRLFKILV